MKNYTLMNLIQSITGYYYKSPQRLERYIDARVRFKQLYFANKETLLEEEINNLKSEYDDLKKANSKHLNTLWSVYLCLGLMVLIAVIYFSMSSFIATIFNASIGLFTISILFASWVLGNWKAGRTQILAKRLSSVESFLQVHTTKLESKQEIQMSKDERNVLLSSISILKDEDIIEIIDNRIFVNSFTYTNNLSPLSQIQLATYLVIYSQNGIIKIKNGSDYKSMAQCIGENMKQKSDLAVNSDSFYVELSRALKPYRRTIYQRE